MLRAENLQLCPQFALALHICVFLLSVYRTRIIFFQMMFSFLCSACFHSLFSGIIACFFLSPLATKKQTRTNQNCTCIACSWRCSVCPLCNYNMTKHLPFCLKNEFFFKKTPHLIPVLQRNHEVVTSPFAGKISVSESWYRALAYTFLLMMGIIIFMDINKQKEVKD